MNNFNFLCALEGGDKEEGKMKTFSKSFPNQKVLLECRNLISHLRCRESPVGAIFTAQDKDAEKSL